MKFLKTFTLFLCIVIAPIDITFAQGISQLEQWRSTTTPFSAITPFTHAKAIYAPYSHATTSSLAATVLCLTGDTCRTTWPTGGSDFATTSADYWIGTYGKGFFFSTTSAAYHLTTYDKGFFFSTTSADYWETQQAARGSGGGLATSSLAATYPIQLNTGAANATFSLAFGTTTSNTWAGTQTFSNTSATNATTSSLYVTQLTSALSLFDANSQATEYAGTSCTNQFVRSLNGSGVATCATADISSDTNLTAGDGLTLTDDDLDCNTASGSVFGCLASADWTTFNNKENALTFTYPLTRSTNTISLAFGTTTSNAWGGTQSFTSIGVGTTSPTRPVEVNGQIYADNVADGPLSGHVFGSEYMYAFHKKMYDGGVPVVVLSGDSTTAGGGITNSNYLLENLLYTASDNNYKDISISNAGHSGASTTQWASTYIYEDIDLEPDLYVVRWGINDPYYGGSTTTFNNALRSGLETFRATSTVQQAACILMTPNSTNDTPNGRDATWYKSINPLVRQAARDYQCAFVDTYAFFYDLENADEWMDDPYADGRHIHPLELENLWIAGEIAELMFPPYLNSVIGETSFKNLTNNRFSSSTSTAPTSYAKGLSFTRAADSSWPYNGANFTLRHTDGVWLQLNSPFTSSSIGLAWRGGNSSQWNPWQYAMSTDANRVVNGGSAYFTADLTAAGNIGIGTTTPQTALHAVGTAPVLRMESSSSLNSGFFGATGNFATFAVNRNPSTGVFVNASKAAAQMNMFATSSDFHIRFYTSATDGTISGTPRMTIEGNGTIGIASTTPWAQLTVTNAGTVPSFVVEDQASDTSPFFIGAGGDIGIGTTTVHTRLDVTGTSPSANAQMTIPENTFYGFKRNDNAIVGVIGTSGSAGSRNIQVGTASGEWGSGSVKIFAGSFERLSLTSGGLVGVGTTTPWARFSIAGSTGGTVPVFSVSTSTSAGATTTVFQIAANGNVGIGTTTPSARFAIEAAGGTLFQILYNATTMLMSVVDNVVTLLGTWDFSGATVKQDVYASFTYSTTTAWTGTTTIPLGPAYTAESFGGIKCFTDTGTLWLTLSDGSNAMNYLQASTTVGSVTLSTNNTFTAGEKRYVSIGNPASSPTSISCTTERVVNN